MLPIFVKNLSKLLLLISLISNLGFSVYIWKNRNKPAANEVTYPLVNTRQQIPVEKDIQAKGQILHYTGLRDKLDEEIKKYNLTEEQVGLFLQDGQTGAWLGINETSGFTPASLLKMPIAVTILEKVQANKLRLTDTVLVTEEDLNDQSGKLYEKGAGFRLTLQEALEAMIHNSDNTAKNVLYRLVSQEEIDTLFEHIGIPNPYLGINGQLVTPRGYIRVFKSLYFATFLTPEYSQKLLNLATDTNEESLLAGGVPPEIQVVHKYGERPDGLSDCGIVYHPKNPYFLCIMTKDVVDPGTKAIHKQLFSELSRIIYNFIEQK